MTKKILAIVEDPEMLESLCGILDGEARVTACLPDIDEASRSVDKWVRQFDLVVIEDDHRPFSGVNLMLKAHALRRKLPIAIISRDEDPDGYLSILKMGAVQYSVYPFDSPHLKLMVDMILSNERAASPFRI